ncbi:nSTAND1 domain-containing NTPase [Catenulispora rubra]|uniref:nSTAND1 domain-containing NTPase n=1 Tax=Catenulispora rubra TaxID=280293 RepID=UPI0018923B60|nr:trypsin-like peptidase domain-containing protein [Catenulispora rubra]
MAADGPEKGRAVQVVAHHRNGKDKLGSGYLVTANLVITAQHVVGDAARVSIRFVDAPGRVRKETGRTEWAHEDVDVALVRLNVSVSHPGSIKPVRYGRLTGEAECQAVGYPWFTLRDGGRRAAAASPGKYRESRHIRATCNPFNNDISGMLQLAVGSPPPPHPDGPERSPWEGMSGAAVFAEGVLIGIVTDNFWREGPGLLTARRVEQWYTLPTDQLAALSGLIGVPDADHQLIPMRSITGPAAPSRGSAASRPSAVATAMTESPYRGLAAFEEQDADFYFGRNEAVGQVLRRMSHCLSSSGLLMVSGVSGVGKSSLLQAGVLSQIRSDGLDGAPEAAQWPSVVLTPGRDPLHELANIAALAGLDAATTHQAIKADPSGFALTARQVAQVRPVGTEPGRLTAGRSRRLLLIVDQFEQLFTQCHDEDQRVAFLTALEAAAGCGSDAGNRAAALVVLVVRADFEARCAAYPLLTNVVQDRYLLTAMTERQLRMAITEPAKELGSDVDDELVRQLLEEIRGQAPGRDPMGPGRGIAAPAGILPMLSYALDTAWRTRAQNKLMMADYDRTGGIERAVATSADEAYNELTPAQQATARTVFLRLTATSPDGTTTADRVPRAELLGGKDTMKARDVEAVLEAFAGKRLLTLSAESVEISHEVLFRAWPQLYEGWLFDTQADRIIRSRMRTAAGEWVRHSRDPSYLYAGSLLKNALDTTDRIGPARQPELSSVEQEFLHASTRARRRIRASRRGGLAALLALTLGLAVATAAAYQASRTATAQRDTAARQRNAAIASQLDTESQTATDPTASKIESLAAWHIDPTPQTRYAMINAALRPIPGSLANYMLTLPVNQVAISPDGKMLATGSHDGTVRLWNVATAQPIGRPLINTNQYTLMAFSPDSQTLAVAGRDGIRVWNVATQQPMGQLDMPPDLPMSIAFSPDGKILATGNLDGTVGLWNFATRQAITGILTERALTTLGVAAVVFSPDGKTLATGDEYGVQLWDISTKKRIGNPLSALRVRSMAFSPDGRTLATGHDDGTRLWNVTTGKQIGNLLAASAQGRVINVAFSSDGTTLTASDVNDTVQSWNVATQQPIGQPCTFSDANYPGFYTAVYRPGGHTLVLGLQDGMAWLCSPAAQHPTDLPLTITTVGGAASAAFSPDGTTVATGSEDGTVRLWDVATQQQIGQTLTIGSDYDGVASVAFSRDGRLLVAGSQSGLVRLWDVATQRQIGRDIADGSSALDGVASLAFNPDGRALAIGDNMGRVSLWDVATRRQTSRFSTTRSTLSPATSVAFSPDGRTIATGSGKYGILGDTARLWNTATQRSIGNPLGIGQALAFSPDGRTVVTGGPNDVVQLWNSATGQQVGQPITGGTTGAKVNAATFSPDGQVLVTIGDNGTTQVWDVATRQLIGQPITGSGTVHAAIFRPDGLTLAIADTGGIRAFDANEIMNPLAQICAQIGYEISPDEWRQYVPPGPAYSRVCP